VARRRPIASDNRVDSSKAERELGVERRAVEETLRDAVAWPRGAHML